MSDDAESSYLLDYQWLAQPKRTIVALGTSLKHGSRSAPGRVLYVFDGESRVRKGRIQEVQFSDANQVFRARFTSSTLGAYIAQKCYEGQPLYYEAVVDLAHDSEDAGVAALSFDKCRTFHRNEAESSAIFHVRTIEPEQP